MKNVVRNVNKFNKGARKVAAVCAGTSVALIGTTVCLNLGLRLAATIAGEV